MYGENGALLRAELSALLAQHRIQLRLGGGGSHSVPVTTTRLEREEIGKQIRRYRQSVLLWCQQASRAVAPYASSNLSLAAPSPFRLPPTEHGGLASLRVALDHAVGTSSAPLPGLDELVASQELPLVEHWRQAARAAALGEHDFDAGLRHDSLNAPQAHTLIGDIAAVVRALVVLDQRYRSIPGWERLRRPERLGWSALACALDVSLEPPSYTIDTLGWRAHTNVMPGPARPGLLGVPPSRTEPRRQAAATAQRDEPAPHRPLAADALRWHRRARREHRQGPSRPVPHAPTDLRRPPARATQRRLPRRHRRAGGR
jgi:hypothetical protein